MNGLTHRQQKVLAFIREYGLENGRCPSYQDICEGAGIKSKSNVHDAIVLLEERGKLRRLHNKSRSIELIPASPVLTVELPTHLYHSVQDLARKAKVTPEAVVIEAVRDGFKALNASRRSADVPKTANCETSDSTRRIHDPDANLLPASSPDAAITGRPLSTQDTALSDRPSSLARERQTT